jgi:hypothetical protein
VLKGPVKVKVNAVCCTNQDLTIEKDGCLIPVHTTVRSPYCLNHGSTKIKKQKKTGGGGRGGGERERVLHAHESVN